MSHPVTISRLAVEELVTFLGTLPINSGASIYYGALRAALAAPGLEVVRDVKDARTKTKGKPSTPSTASLSADKVEAKRKKAAENARKWRQKKALEKSAAQAAASNPAPVPEAVQPVLFTG